MSAPRRLQSLVVGLSGLLAACGSATTPTPGNEPVPSTARWGLDPADLPGPDDRSITVGAWEVECSDGREISDKLLEPEIWYGPDAVTITLWLEPLPPLGRNEAFTCELRNPTTFTIELSEPLGSRALVDGNKAVGGAVIGGVVDPGLMGAWQLVEGTIGDEAIAPVTDHPVTFALHGDTVAGSGGCNSYRSVPITVGADEIRIPGVFSHLAACPDGRGAVETRFFAALQLVTQWRLETARLALEGPNLTLTFRRTPSPGCEPGSRCSQVWVSFAPPAGVEQPVRDYELWIGDHAFSLPAGSGGGVTSIDAPQPVRVRLLEAEACGAVVDFVADPGTYFVIGLDEAEQLTVEDLSGTEIELGPGLTESAKPAC